MFSGVHSGRVKVDGLDVRYFSSGHGDPLIVIHGGSDGASPWMGNIVELSRNYTVYVPDLPGFGESQPFEGKYYIPELVDFLDKFSHKLGLEKFHLVGHSLGGGVALSYTLKNPQKIGKLVLVSSLGLGKEIAFWVRWLSPLRSSIGVATIGIFRAVKWLVRTLLLPVNFVEPLSRTSFNLGAYVANIKEQTTVFVNQLSELMVPTLVVWGAKDPVVPVRQAYAAAQLIPVCQVKVFEDAGHSVYREKVDEFSRLLTGFLG